MSNFRAAESCDNCDHMKDDDNPYRGNAYYGFSFCAQTSVIFGWNPGEDVEVLRREEAGLHEIIGKAKGFTCDRWKAMQ